MEIEGFFGIRYSTKRKRIRIAFTESAALEGSTLQKGCWGSHGEGAGCDIYGCAGSISCLSSRAGGMFETEKERESAG